jgi:hypothetical protein
VSLRVEWFHEVMLRSCKFHERSSRIVQYWEVFCLQQQRNASEDITFNAKLQCLIVHKKVPILRAALIAYMSLADVPKC